MKPFLVHIHIYYKNLYDELKECIKSLNGYEYKLIVTTVHEDSELKDRVVSDFKNADFYVVPNLGFDLGPFVYALDKVNLSDYSYVIKLHTKRDIPLNENKKEFEGPKWRNALLRFIRNKDTFNIVLDNLESNQKIGMHGPRAAFFNKKTDDHYAHKIADEYFAQKGLKKVSYRFVGGTMFMVRAEILQTIKDLGISQSDFEAPDETHRGCQMAHIFERLCGYVVYEKGFKIADCTENVMISELKYRLNIVKNEVLNFIFTKRVTSKNKLLIKVLKIPVFSMKLKDKL